MSDPFLYLTLDLVRWENRVLTKEQVESKNLCLSLAKEAIQLCVASGITHEELLSLLSAELGTISKDEPAVPSSEVSSVVDPRADAVEAELADVGLRLLSLCSRRNISLKNVLQERLVVLKHKK
jgi:hypothetical protein